MNPVNIISKAIKLFLTANLLLIPHNRANANDEAFRELMKDYRDQGVIGEKKTRVAKPTSGVAIYKTGESLVTPLVVGDEAVFGSEFGKSLTLRYGFRFACVHWKYDVAGYLTNHTKEDNVGWIVNLESPDKRTRVNVKLWDVTLSAAFDHPLTAEQIQQRDTEQGKLDSKYREDEAAGIKIASRYTVPYPDPLSGDERILAGKEVISRWVGKGIDSYEIGEGGQIHFSSEKVSNKEFVRGDLDLNKGNIKKKCVIWVLNLSGYRFKAVPDKRRANMWVCQVVSDPPDFSSIDIKAHRILETLRFAPNDQNVYPDLRE